ncbi:Methyltransferase domain-containing protein [Desulfonispora thiosulfatigenes DSM 11270]|uniref:Methyltransferase domain-containing protein n=1 Tax=Desulfonispora thiosulfatigenes DSM 11270 TaxID=656914 RepID=A0A1W1UGP0_DESTI|nr:class I SAM-dependent methyltransferase [Desulfonispora thiosulfatigenes]SMB80278.1 Methyltransferase domain-containing protein [Desulfonispora thiosulfatigenes DSM 11270]
MSYQDLASVYDFLMEDIDYEAWANYLVTLIDQSQVTGNKILDLGCGTGKISLLLAQKGFDVVGVDNSIEMLTEAEQRFRQHNAKVSLYKQDIRNLTINEKVDIAISTFDTFNYLLTEDDLLKAFSNVYKILTNNGVLIFDINTYYYLKTILGNNIFTYNTPELVYLWENEFCETRDVCQMNLTFFVQEAEEESYVRFDEEHKQKAFKLEKVRELLTKVEFKQINVYGKLSFTDPINEEEKVFFIAKK